MVTFYVKMRGMSTEKKGSLKFGSIFPSQIIFAYVFENHAPKCFVRALCRDDDTLPNMIGES
jgi:hypothetical protein